MQLAETNKKMRKELELLTKDMFALSAIYRVLLNFISEEKIKQIKSEVRMTVSRKFTKEEVDSHCKRSSDHLGRTTLEFEVEEIFKPLEAR
jgi:uncharacterized membrane protein